MSRERSKGIVGIFILVTVLFFIFIMFAFFTIFKLKDADDLGSDLLDSQKKSPIAVITIENEIRESRKVVEQLLIAEEQKDIKAIIL